MNYLPDVSTWLALVYSGHVHHRPAMEWFDSLQEERSAFVCRVSQMGLLRLLTQAAAVGRDIQTQREAWSTYDRLRDDFRVSFGDEPYGMDGAFRRSSSRDAPSPKLWTDDYLMAFASLSELTLVTCDRSLAGRSTGAFFLTP